MKPSSLSLFLSLYILLFLLQTPHHFRPANPPSTLFIDSPQELLRVSPSFQSFLEYQTNLSFLLLLSHPAQGSLTFKVNYT